MPPPPVGDEWDVQFGTKKAVDGWRELCRQAPTAARTCWQQLLTAPTERSSRQDQLKGDYATRDRGGVALPQWQYEVTGGGRVWYLVDADRRMVWVVKAGCGHPRETDTQRRRQS